jgi:hypothetical protein
MLERDFQPWVIKELYRRLPGCIVQKLDTEYQQGIPDLLILWDWFWATLEVKKKKPKPSDFEPNQEYFIEKMDEMSFSACIYPENAEEVLNDLQRQFEIRRLTRISES